MEWRFLGKTFYVPKALVVLLAGMVCVGLIVGGYFMLDNGMTSRNGVLYTNATASQSGTANVHTTASASAQPPTQVLWEIYIVGAVQQPGIYVLQEGALVYHAIEAAGGLLSSANPETVNMVQELQDHMMIHILTEKERAEQGRDSSLILTKNGEEFGGNQSAEGNGEGVAERININSATREALMTLPGIGETRAESIIAYRTEHGPFQTIEDIMLVNGIKESVFAQIKDRITT